MKSSVDIEDLKDREKMLTSKDSMLIEEQNYAKVFLGIQNIHFKYLTWETWQYREKQQNDGSTDGFIKTIIRHFHYI